MKPALLRPQALRDRQGELRYYRQVDSQRDSSHPALKVAQAANEALDPFELEPGMGSPGPGVLLGTPELRAWRVGKSPLHWCCFERGDHLDGVRLLGQRQDIAAIPDEGSARTDAAARTVAALGRRSTTGVRRAMPGHGRPEPEETFAVLTSAAPCRQSNPLTGT